jgi:hypothetical protein
VGIEGVEGFAVVLVERQSELDSLGQIRICNEMPSKRHQVRISLFDNRLGSVGFKTAGSDDLPLNIFRKRSAAIGA